VSGLASPWSPLNVEGLGGTMYTSVSGRVNRVNLLKRELSLPRGEALHTDQVNGCLVAGIRG